MATTSTTTTTKTVDSTTAKAPSLNGFDLAMVAASALVPMALSAMGMVPNPIVAAVAGILGAVWTVAKTFLASKHLGSRADVEAAVAKVLAGIEKATGKDIPADIESAIEFGAGAAAQSAGLTKDATATAAPQA